VTAYRNPIPTVDVVIELPNHEIVLIERRNEPTGWAIPGGFVDEGEQLETAARREAKEETGLDVELIEQFFTYSDPRRDPRKHTITTVFLARATGTPLGADDAKAARSFPANALPSPLCFDHARILADWREYVRTGKRPKLETASEGAAAGATRDSK
jgi:8-oxo-dGTP diphosphatase